MSIVLGDHIRVHEIIVMHKHINLSHFHYIFEDMKSKKFAALQSSISRSDFSEMVKRIDGYDFAFIFNSLDEALEKSISWLDDPSGYDSTIYFKDKK